MTRSARDREENHDQELERCECPVHEASIRPSLRPEIRSYDCFVINCQLDVAVMGPLDYETAIAAAQYMNASRASTSGPRFTVEHYPPSAVKGDHGR